MAQIRLNYSQINVFKTCIKLNSFSSDNLCSRCGVTETLYHLLVSCANVSSYSTPILAELCLITSELDFLQTVSKFNIENIYDFFDYACGAVRYCSTVQ